MIVYEKDGIKISKKTTFGKTFLSGHNENNMATVTSVLKCDSDDSELMEKIAKMVVELEKRVTLDLTEKLENIERKAIKELAE